MAETIEEEDKRHLIFCEICTLVMSNKGIYRLKLNKWAASTQAEIESTSSFI